MMSRSLPSLLANEEFMKKMLDSCLKDVQNDVQNDTSAGSIDDGTMTRQQIDEAFRTYARKAGEIIDNDKKIEQQKRIEKNIQRKVAMKKNISNEDKYVESKLKIATLPIQYNSGDSSEEETKTVHKKVKRRNMIAEPIEPAHKSKNSVKKDAKKAKKSKKAKK